MSRLINEKSKLDPANKAMVLDQWMTPPMVVKALIELEWGAIPHNILEPCAGDGTGFVQPLETAGFKVWARDIDPDFGWPVSDFLTDPVPADWAMYTNRAIVTNPPFSLAEQFVRKAIETAPYSAWLLRLNWLEGVKRGKLFDEIPPVRIRVSSRRLPFHRFGYTGPKASSNTAHAFFIWDAAAQQYARDHGTTVSWFDWQDFAAAPAEEAELEIEAA